MLSDRPGNVVVLSGRAACPPRPCGRAFAVRGRFVLDAVGFDDRMRASRFVVTGEGRAFSAGLVHQRVQIGRVADSVSMAGAQSETDRIRRIYDERAATYDGFLGIEPARNGDGTGSAIGVVGGRK